MSQGWLQIVDAAMQLGTALSVAYTAAVLRNLRRGIKEELERQREVRQEEPS